MTSRFLNQHQDLSLLLWTAVMARAGSRNRPAAYPKFPFHVVRFCQMLASLIIAGEMFYFVWQIKHGGHRVPWMFFFVSEICLYNHSHRERD
jgi:hypothetical protein